MFVRPRWDLKRGLLSGAATLPGLEERPLSEHAVGRRHLPFGPIDREYESVQDFEMIRGVRHQAEKDKGLVAQAGVGVGQAGRNENDVSRLDPPGFIAEGKFSRSVQDLSLIHI